MYFTSAYRALIGSCVAGQGDVMVGAAILIARANGLSEKTFREQLIKMVINNETTYGLGIAAATLGEKHPSGAWIPDALLANVNKVHVATLPYETKVLCEDIAGGIGETGCMPSWKDFQNEEYGKLLEKISYSCIPRRNKSKNCIFNSMVNLWRRNTWLYARRRFSCSSKTHDKSNSKMETIHGICSKTRRNQKRRHIRTIKIKIVTK